jgi:Na+-transporting NADH:ubiquinone oxidoreductase subunit NqrB
VNTRLSAPSSLQHPQLVHFIRSPKGILFLQLSVLTLLALTGEGPRAIGGVVAGVGAAVATDSVVMWRKQPKSESLSSALLSGFIVALVLSPAEPLYVPALGAVVAILSRHFIRIAGVHLLNPAALGLMVTWALLSSQQSWWGGLSNLPGLTVLIVLALGGFIVWQVNKFPSVLAFLYAYFWLFVITAFVGNKVAVAEIFRQPFLGTVFFFAVFMLTDPPTTPARVSHQIWFGLAVGGAAFGIYLLTGGAVYYLLLALLPGNLLEGLRRAAGIRRGQTRRGRDPEGSGRLSTDTLGSSLGTAAG